MEKIVLYGLSGSGKSTSAHIVKEYFEGRGLRVEVLKLSEPLYELQREFYSQAGRAIHYYDQDQPLLELIADRLRLINSTSLVDHFMGRLNQSEADVILNDDLRDPFIDYPSLKEQGFIFLRIRCSEELRLDRLVGRSNKSTVLHSKSTADIEMIRPDYEIWNEHSGLDNLKKCIVSVLEGIK